MLLLLGYLSLEGAVFGGTLLYDSLTFLLVWLDESLILPDGECADGKGRKNTP